MPETVYNPGTKGSERTDIVTAPGNKIGITEYFLMLLLGLFI